MSGKIDQFKTGQRKLFDRSEAAKKAAFKVWVAMCSTVSAKSMTLPPGDYLSYQNLFFNCVRQRGEKCILNVEQLRKVLDTDWDDWLEALREAGEFSSPASVPSREDLFHRLCFEIPEIDWREFRSELRSLNDVSIPKDAFLTMNYLCSSNDTIAPAELGAKLFRDSKRLKNSSVLTWLVRLLRQKNNMDDSRDDAEILTSHGLMANPTASTILLYGSFFYENGGKKISWIDDLYHRKESAILSCDNLRDLEKVTTSQPVLTIENETVFNHMKLSEPDYALIYTAGFPGRAVRKWIAALSAETPLFHWGDSDPEGYEIAAVLHRIHPLKLFRCDVTSLEALKSVAIALPPTKQRRAERLAQNPEFPFLPEIQWILEHRCWIEQEGFYSDDNKILLKTKL